MQIGPADEPNDAIVRCESYGQQRKSSLLLRLYVVSSTATINHESSAAAPSIQVNPISYQKSLLFRYPQFIPNPNPNPNQVTCADVRNLPLELRDHLSRHGVSICDKP